MAYESGVWVLGVLWGRDVITDQIELVGWDMQ